MLKRICFIFMSLIVLLSSCNRSITNQNIETNSENITHSVIKDKDNMNLENAKELIINATTLMNGIADDCYPTTKIIGNTSGMDIYECTGDFVYFNTIMKEAKEYYSLEKLVELELNIRHLYKVDDKVGVVDVAGGEFYTISSSANIEFITNEENKKTVSITAEMNDLGDSANVQYTIEKLENRWIITDMQGFYDFSYENSAIIKYISDGFYASSSSQLSGYPPENVLDSDMNTAWAEGVEGDGTGEWLELDLNNIIQINGIQILNGYGKTKDTYYENNRLKKIRIEFSDDTSLTEELSDDIYGYGSLGLQNISFKNSISTKYIKIYILEMYPGSKYNDTCISDIRIY